MAADQQFCLRWNNHQSTLISVFDTLLENGTLVDCTLAAEGQYLKAHKVVLSACSPYMETLLSQNYDKHPILILKDVKFTELKSMMDYMYRGEVNISQDQLGTFLKAAESLQIKGLSENGEGDARDVGSTNANPPPPRRPPATRPEPEAAQSPAHRSRDGSVSPSSRKRRRLRRNSDDGDNHIESNSCDVPAQSTPVPNIPASITTTPIRTPIVKPEVNDRLDHNTLPAESGLLKEKIEPAEPLLEPKTEYLEDLNNDDSVEDLTLDDDDEMDMSQMSNLSNMSRPGPSHGADLSNQGFPPWQLGNQSGTDEVFMAAQEAVNAHRDSQGEIHPRSQKRIPFKTRDLISNRNLMSEANSEPRNHHEQRSHSEPSDNTFQGNYKFRNKTSKSGDHTRICNHPEGQEHPEPSNHTELHVDPEPCCSEPCNHTEPSIPRENGNHPEINSHIEPCNHTETHNHPEPPNSPNHPELPTGSRNYYKCHKCGRLCKYNLSRRLHQLWTHKKFGCGREPQFYCILCETSNIGRKDILTIHKKPSQAEILNNWRATAERTSSPFVSGSMSPGLEENVTPGIRYKCSTCWFHQLWIHKKFSHRRAPQFHCISCDESFVKKDVMMIHKKNYGYAKRPNRNRLGENNE